MTKLLVVGRGSPRDEDVYKIRYPEFGDRTIDDFAHTHGIKVYHDANDLAPLTMSCHKAPFLTEERAEELGALVGRGDEVVAVLYGGKSLALPSIVSARARNVPVIGVPIESSWFEGISSFLSVFDLPKGCAVGYAGGIEKAVLSATRILTSCATKVSIECGGAEDEYKSLKKALEGFGIAYEEGVASADISIIVSAPGDMLTEFAAYDTIKSGGIVLEVLPSSLTDEQKKFVGRVGVYRFKEGLDNRGWMVIQSAENAALFAAQIIGLRNKGVRDAVDEYYEGMAMVGYSGAISRDSFM